VIKAVAHDVFVDELQRFYGELFFLATRFSTA